MRCSSSESGSRGSRSIGGGDIGGTIASARFTEKIAKRRWPAEEKIRGAVATRYPAIARAPATGGFRCKSADVACRSNRCKYLIMNRVKWCERGDSFFAPPRLLRNLLKTSYARTAKSANPAGCGHDLGTADRGTFRAFAVLLAEAPLIFEVLARSVYSRVG